METAIDGLVLTVPDEEFELMIGQRELDPNRLQHLDFAKNLLEYITDGTGAEVSCDRTPIHNVCLVSVAGPELVFRNPNWLMKLCEISSRMEAYPSESGDGIVVDFLFPGMTRQVDAEIIASAREMQRTDDETEGVAE